MVKSYVGRCGKKTYPDMPWEPKPSFHAVAGFFERVGSPPVRELRGETR